MVIRQVALLVLALYAMSLSYVFHGLGQEQAVLWALISCASLAGFFKTTSQA